MPSTGANLEYRNCTFTEDFEHVVFLPSSGVPSHWAPTVFTTVVKILKDVVYPHFNVDPRKNTLVGQSAGGRGLFDFASMYPDVFAALVPVCVAGVSQRAKNTFVSGRFDRGGLLRKQRMIWASHKEQETEYANQKSFLDKQAEYLKLKMPIWFIH